MTVWRELAPLFVAPVTLAAVLLATALGGDGAAVAGMVGSTISAVMLLPQALHVWRLRNSPERLRGVSVPTQALVVSNALTWFIYGFAAQEFWPAVPGLLNFPVACLTIALVLRGRRFDA